MCGSTTQRHSLHTHLITCNVFNSPLQCKHCGEHYSKDTPHLEECPKQQVYCPYLCGEELRQEDIKLHLKVCPKLYTKPFQANVVNHPTTYRLFSSEEDDKPDLLHTAKKMLQLRTEMYSVHERLIDTKVALVRLENDSATDCGKDEPEGEDEKVCKEEHKSEVNEDQLSKLRRYELELEMEKELTENALINLRKELHKIHSVKT